MTRVILFNKPDGVMSTFTDEAGRETLKDYVKVPGVYSAGRLDRDSEGLLLLTDDGELIHRITDPKFVHPKTYLVQVEGVVTNDALDRIRAGIQLGSYTTRPASVEQIDEPFGLAPKRRRVTPHGPTAWLKLTLFEGKKHEIRHMTAAVGLPTLRLVRSAIGPIQLGDLPAGSWRELAAEEILSLKSFVAKR